MGDIAGGTVTHVAAWDTLDDLSWGFLNSEFVGDLYMSWPFERRLDAYLRHRHLDDIVDDGTAYDQLLHRVMVNIAPAKRSGILRPGTWSAARNAVGTDDVFRSD